MIPVPRAARYQDRVQGAAGLPCVICGRPIASPKWYVHLHDGGASIVTDAEAAGLDPASDMGVHPIGSECLKKHPEVRPYATPA